MKKIAVFLVCVGLTMFVCGVVADTKEPPVAPQSGGVVITIPKEQVKREGRFMVAKSVVGKITVTIGGKSYSGDVTFPDVKVRRTNLGEMYVDPCVVKGSVR